MASPVSSVINPTEDGATHGFLQSRESAPRPLAGAASQQELQSLTPRTLVEADDLSIPLGSVYQRDNTAEPATACCTIIAIINRRSETDTDCSFCELWVATNESMTQKSWILRAFTKRKAFWFVFNFV